MSVDAARIIVIVCRDEAYANLLGAQWHNITQWCGFWVAHGPVTIKHHKTLLALVWGGALSSSLIPNGTDSIGTCNTADFLAVKAILWPEDYKIQRIYNKTVVWLFSQEGAGVI